MSKKQDENKFSMDVELFQCRTCLQEIDTNSIIIDLFQCWILPQKGTKSKIADDLAMLANIEINQGDKYPKVICKPCFFRLQSACDFVFCVRKNDRVLRQRTNDGSNMIWPESIHIDKNTNKTICNNVMDIEIKPELSENEYADSDRSENCRNNDLPTLKIKIEPEELIQENTNIEDSQNAVSKISNMHAQYFLYKSVSSEANQIGQTKTTKYDIIETQNDQNTSNLKHIVPNRTNNKAAAAERSRLYRERHRKEINQRRREIRRHQQNLHQIQNASINIQNIEVFEQYSDETCNKKPNSHTQRQRRYYERHRDEINQRKRDQRLKQNNLQSAPTTAAERNRKYRERKKQEINARRRINRQRKQKLQEIHADNINGMNSIEQITEPTPDYMQNIKHVTESKLDKKQTFNNIINSIILAKAL